MVPSIDVDGLVRRALAAIEHFRARSVPYVLVSTPSIAVAEEAAIRLSAAGMMIDGVNQNPCGVRVKIPAARLPDDPGAPHGRCARHGAPLVLRTDPRLRPGPPYCSGAGTVTPVWTEAAGWC
jgi:hypothetical protein